MRHLLQPHVGARPDSTSAIAHWKLDELTIGNAVDALTGYDLTANGSTGTCFVSLCRSFRLYGRAVLQRNESVFPEIQRRLSDIKRNGGSASRKRRRGVGGV